jgi:acylphosphatase
LNAKRILVRGQVQGVFYRNWTVETAKRLGISGWVRNLRSGEVEILAAGDPAALDALVRECRNGPPAAVVEELLASESETEPPAGFTKRPTL